MCLLIAGLSPFWLLIDFGSDQKLDGGKAFIVYSYNQRYNMNETACYELIEL